MACPHFTTVGGRHRETFHEDRSSTREASESEVKEETRSPQDPVAGDRSERRGASGKGKDLRDCPDLPGPQSQPSHPTGPVDSGPVTLPERALAPAPMDSGNTSRGETGGPPRLRSSRRPGGSSREAGESLGRVWFRPGLPCHGLPSPRPLPLSVLSRGLVGPPGPRKSRALPDRGARAAPAPRVGAAAGALFGGSERWAVDLLRPGPDPCRPSWADPDPAADP